MYNDPREIVLTVLPISCPCKSVSMFPILREVRTTNVRPTKQFDGNITHEILKRCLNYSFCKREKLKNRAICKHE